MCLSCFKFVSSVEANRKTHTLITHQWRSKILSGCLKSGWMLSWWAVIQSCSTHEYILDYTWHCLPLPSISFFLSSYPLTWHHILCPMSFTSLYFLGFLLLSYIYHADEHGFSGRLCIRIDVSYNTSHLFTTSLR